MRVLTHTPYIRGLGGQMQVVENIFFIFFILSQFLQRGGQYTGRQFIEKTAGKNACRWIHPASSSRRRSRSIFRYILNDSNKLISYNKNSGTVTTKSLIRSGGVIMVAMITSNK